jgi:hypothetical protein
VRHKFFDGCYQSIPVPYDEMEFNALASADAHAVGDDLHGISPKNVSHIADIDYLNPFLDVKRMGFKYQPPVRYIQKTSDGFDPSEKISPGLIDQLLIDVHLG